MRIFKCIKCNKYIYAHESARCFYCGNTERFEEVYKVPVHEMVADDFERMEVFVEQQQFYEAFDVSDKILEWMPDVAGVFWYRLLIRKQCVSIADLLSKGVDCEEDADFYNAVRFSGEEERTIYEDIRDCMEQMKQALKCNIAKHEAEDKAKTDLIMLGKNMEQELRSRKGRLFELWSQLDKVERSMYAVEMDCRLSAEEYKLELKQAMQMSDALFEEIYDFEECDEEALHEYYVKLGSVLMLSEQAKHDINQFAEHHPKAIELAGLILKRDKINSQLNQELEALKEYEAGVQKTISSVEEIEKEHRKAKRAADKYDFTEAAAILGEEAFHQILHEIGIDV